MPTPMVQQLWSLFFPPTSCNLLCYIEQAAILPRLVYDQTSKPPEGHKSHNSKFRCLQNPHRQIHAIHTLVCFSDLVIAWTKKYIPNEPLLPHCDYNPEDAPPDDSVPSSWLRYYMKPASERQFVSDTASLTKWLDRYPLRIVQNVLHACFPSISRWTFPDDQWVVDDPSDTLRYTFWTSGDGTSLTLFCQPPWVLTPEDMTQFVSLKSLPPDKNGYQSKERLWAKIWDICTSEQSPFFILTSYEQWVFGSFSRGSTAAFISPIYNYTSLSPSIIRTMVYWLASGSGVSEGFLHGSFPEPVPKLQRGYVPPKASRTAMEVPFAFSESSWCGQSQEPGSSAGVDDIAPYDLVSDNEGLTSQRLHGPQHMSPQDFTRRYRTKVYNWLSKMEQEPPSSAPNLDSEMYPDDEDSDGASTPTDSEPHTPTSDDASAPFEVHGCIIDPLDYGPEYDIRFALTGASPTEPPRRRKYFAPVPAYTPSEPSDIDEDEEVHDAEVVHVDVGGYHDYLDPPGGYAVSVASSDSDETIVILPRGYNLAEDRV